MCQLKPMRFCKIDTLCITTKNFIILIESIIANFGWNNCSSNLNYLCILKYLMVPVGEGIGDTKGETNWVSTLSGRAGLCIGGRGPMSSRREVNANLI